MFASSSRFTRKRGDVVKRTKQSEYNQAQTTVTLAKQDRLAILSDLIYARVLEPASKRSSYKIASEFVERPSYALHDIYRALDILGNECDLIQAEVYKNSNFITNRNDKILYYDCSNYYFEIEQEDGDKKYGKILIRIMMRLQVFMKIGLLLLRNSKITSLKLLLNLIGL